MENFSTIRNKIIHELTSQVRIMTSTYDGEKIDVQDQFCRENLYAVPQHCNIEYMRKGLEIAIHHDSLLLDERYPSQINIDLANVLELLSIQLSVILVEVKRGKRIKTDLFVNCLQKLEICRLQSQKINRASPLPLASRTQQLTKLLHDINTYNELRLTINESITSS